MANSENTAVNELIARVTGGPVTATLSGVPAAPPSPAPLPPAPLPATPMPATAAVPSLSPPRDPASPRTGIVTERSPLRTPLPASMPVAAPFEARSGLPLSYPVIPRATRGEAAPVLAEPPPAVELPPEASVAPMVSDDAPTEQTWQPQLGQGLGDEYMVGTLQLRRRADVAAVVRKLVVPIALLVFAGIAIGGYVAFSGRAAVPSRRAPTGDKAHGQPVAVPPSASIVEPAQQPLAAAPASIAPIPSPAPPAPPAPTSAADRAAAPPTSSSPASVVERAAAPPVLVEVRIDSIPSGATVTLVDRGMTQFLGNTPLNAAVDPSRAYELVFTHPGRPPQQEHLDTSTTRHIAVTLGQRPTPSKPAAPPRPPAARSVDRAPLEDGTLMISSKPPCEVVIDGVPTGLTTPQRSIKLAPGRHKITLINRENDLRKTVGVQILAGGTEKVIEDLMQ